LPPYEGWDEGRRERDGYDRLSRSRGRRFGGEGVAMAAGNERVPPGLDVSMPNVARVYDYTLGGKDNSRQ
jgi:hypothetical protein